MSYEIDIPDDLTDEDKHAPDEERDTHGDHPEDGGVPGDGIEDGRDQGAGHGHHHDCRCGGDAEADHHAGGGNESLEDSLEDAVGISIPEEHVGAFVAEAFEDAERDTTWADVVDAFVDPSARAAWDDLDPDEQAVEILDAAARYDDRAIEHLESIPLDAGQQDDPDGLQDDPDGLDEALRCRRNADMFRDGIAAAYGDGVLDDADLVAAVETASFATDRIAARERALEDVDAIHDVDFRPYGGQFFDAEQGPDPDVDHDASETW